jgi:hypothetical protein
LKRTREDVDKLIKEDSEKDKKDEVCVFLPTYYLDWWNWFVSVPWQLAAEKLAAKKRAEEERISKLSAAEQKKVGGSSQIKIPLPPINDDPIPRHWTATENAPLENSRARLLVNELRAACFPSWIPSEIRWYTQIKQKTLPII